MAPLASARGFGGTINGPPDGGAGGAHGAEKLHGKDKARAIRLVKAAGKDDDLDDDDSATLDSGGGGSPTMSPRNVRGADRTTLEGTESSAFESGVVGSPRARGVGQFTQGGELVQSTTINGRKQMTFLNNDADVEDGKAASALTRINNQGRQAQLQADTLARKSSIRPASVKATPDAVAEAVVNGTSKMKILIEAMKNFRQTLRAKRDMSDADIEEIRAQQEQYARNKASMTQQIVEIGKKVDVMGRANKDGVIEFADSLIKETEARTGNTELLTCMFSRLINMDWAANALEKRWVLTSAKDGSARFMDAILSIPDYGAVAQGEDFVDTEEASLVELMTLCTANRTQRINVGLVITKHFIPLNLTKYSKRLASMYQKYFADVVSHKRAFENEDRTHRTTLIHKWLNLPNVFPVDFDLEDASDGHTIVTRCIEDNDTGVITLIIKARVPVKWDKSLTVKGLTPLGVAIDGKNKAMVELLLTAEGIKADTEVDASGMTAIEYARESNAGPLIVQSIERKLLREANPVAANFTGTLSRRPGAKSMYGGAMALAASMSGSSQNPAARQQSRMPASVNQPEEFGPLDALADPTIHKMAGGTQKVAELLLGLWAVYDDVKRLAAEMHRSDEAAHDYIQLRDDVPRMKAEIARSIAAIGDRIGVEGKEAKDIVASSAARLIEETDEPSNLDLLKVLLFRVVTVDFAPLLSDHRWAVVAAEAGQVETLRVLLRVPKLWKDEREVAELLNACVSNPRRRLSLCNVFLRYHETLRLATNKQFFQPSFDELWDLLASPSKLTGSDDLPMRKELLYRFMNSKGFIAIRTEYEFGASQTYFSRACRDGDVELVQAMLDMCLVPNINRIHTNKSTALMQAVVGNQVQVVKMLLKEPDIDVHYRSPHGTAVELAVSMKKDPSIIAALKGAEAPR